MTGGIHVTVTRIPPCDICADPAVIDGRTTAGPWANMCEKHWAAIGVGRLGIGFGQRFVLARPGNLAPPDVI